MPRWPVVGLALFACAAERPEPQPPKRPNNELIVGAFERRPPTGTQAVRFDPDGTFRFATTKADLDHTPHLSDGTYQVDGDKLELTATQGDCADQGAAHYEVVISKVGIRFTKLDDACETRARMDGQTWWRIR